jgi:glycosyltransferase involved in cell wall biosynthesis
MKKILIFSLTYYPSLVGGAEVAIKEITDRIDPRDYEFHMVTLRFDANLPKVEKVGNVTVHRIGFAKPSPTAEDLRKFPLHYNKYIFQFSAAWEAIKLHRKNHYHGIWAMMAYSCGVPAAIFKTFYPRAFYILTLQEGDPISYIERKVRPLWPLFIRAFTKADVVQAVSNYLGQWARRRGFKGPLEIIYNGANAKDFSEIYSEKELAELKKKVGKREGDICIVTTSRLAYKNAVDDVIKALPLLPSFAHLLVVGGGPEEKSLKNLACSLEVEKRVKFVGQVDRSETPKYRRIADIFARPSRSEGLGISFASAMAAKLPIIGTQEGGIKEFLFDAQRNPDKPTTGWAVDKDSPEQIAAAVKYIIANPEKVKKITESARRLAYEKYNWDTIAKDMREKIFSRLEK